jgi:hypothetical protein
MSSIDSFIRSHKRLAAWLTFGAAGLATGAVWATGFAEVGGATGTNPASGAPIVAASTPADHTAALSGDVTAGSTLTYNWSGRWGSVADTTLFKVDLSGESASNTYNVAFMLTNGAALSNQGWTSLQLKLERVVASGPGNTCVDSDYDGTQDPKVMAFDAEDAGVYWNGLAGGAVYCLGIHTADGHDIAGTFLRRDSDTVAPSVYPRFVATVDRAT